MSNRRLGSFVVLTLVVGVVSMFGMDGGCPPEDGMTPPPAGQPAEQPGTDPTTNNRPTLNFSSPFANMTIQDGTPVLARYTVMDPEDTTRFSLFADFVDNSVSPPISGTLVLVSNAVQGPGQNTTTFVWNTSGRRAARYVLRGTVTDQVNQLVTSLAAGAVTILPRPDPNPGPDSNPPPRPNVSPTLRLLLPFGVPQVPQGNLLHIEWETTDFDDDVLVTMTAAPIVNGVPGPEVLLVDNLRASAAAPQPVRGVFDWDTSLVVAGRWQFRIEATEDVPVGQKNPDPDPVVFEAQVVFQPIDDENSPPTLVTLLPDRDRGVSDGDIVGVWCNYTNVEADQPLAFTLLLDKDDDPTNDDFNNPNDPNTIFIARRTLDPLIDDLDGDGFVEPNELDRVDSNNGVTGFPFDGLPDTYAPAVIFEGYANGNTLFAFDLGDNFVVDWVGPYTFMWRVDTSQVPVLRDENDRIIPYYLRVTVDDGEDVRHSYAVGRILPLGPAEVDTTVDLGVVGSRLAGARFQGFSEDSNLGSAFLELGDQLFFDPLAPLADDFIIAGRYAQPRSRGNIGAAFYLLGQSPTPDIGRFGGTLVVSGTGVESVGFMFGAGGTTSGDPQLPAEEIENLQVFDRGFNPALPEYTLGITSLAQLPDVSGDGIPEIVFGCPYVAGLFDGCDVDPCDCSSATPCSQGCPSGMYIDGFPTTFSDEDGGCPADDNSPQNQDNGLSIDQGYIFVSSGYLETLGTGFTDLKWIGQQGGHSLAGNLDDEGVPLGIITQTSSGCRMRGGYFGFQGTVPEDHETAPPLDPQNEFGRTVAVIPGFHNTVNDFADLIVSAPGTDISQAVNANDGRIYVLIGFDWTDPAGPGGDGSGNVSWPGNQVLPVCDCLNCFGLRTRIESYPPMITIEGGIPGGRLGYAQAAGDVNADFRPDLVCGAPFAHSTTGNLAAAGRVYVVYQPPGGLGPISLGNPPPPPNDLVSRLELYGTSENDHFGQVQGACGDVNGDTLPDCLVASCDYDDGGNANAGFVGIIYARPELQGTPRLILPVSAIGTTQLRGVKFIGRPGSMAGMSAAGAGDFDGDGIGDFMIAAPNEEREIDGVVHRGVAYLIYGGTHLRNRVLRPDDDGVVDDLGQDVPCIVFVSPYESGSIFEAPLETVGSVGDVDGDGFGDIMIGAPKADFIDPVDGTQLERNTGQGYLIYGNNKGRL